MAENEKTYSERTLLTQEMLADAVAQIREMDDPASHEKLAEVRLACQPEGDWVKRFVITENFRQSVEHINQEQSKGEAASLEAPLLPLSITEFCDAVKEETPPSSYAPKKIPNYPLGKKDDTRHL